MFTLYCLTFGRLYVCKCSSILFKISNYDFWISLLSIIVPPFHLEFINYSLFFPLLVNLSKGCSVLLTLPKNQLFVSLILLAFFFYFVYLFLFLINFALILIIFCDYYLWFVFIFLMSQSATTSYLFGSVLIFNNYICLFALLLIFASILIVFMTTVCAVVGIYFCKVLSTTISYLFGFFLIFSNYNRRTLQHHNTFLHIHWPKNVKHGLL